MSAEVFLLAFQIKKRRGQVFLSFFSNCDDDQKISADIWYLVIGYLVTSWSNEWKDTTGLWFTGLTTVAQYFVSLSSLKRFIDRVRSPA